MGRYFYPIAPAEWLIRYNFNPREYLESVKCPVYIFHGTADHIVPYEIGRRLFMAHEDEKEIYFTTVDGGGHNDLIEYEQFRKEMESVLH